MNLLAMLVGALLRIVPMGGKRTYIMGGIGLVLAVLLLFMGNYAEGGTLLVLALQGIFQRAGTDRLEATILASVAAVKFTPIAEGEPVAVTEPTFPDKKYPLL